MENILITWIKNHSALNLSRVATQAGFSVSLLHGIMKNEKGLTVDKAFKLAKVLSHYGLELRGWRFLSTNQKDKLKCYSITNKINTAVFDAAEFMEFLDGKNL
jgi:AraC-like DNA-binding protein